MRPVMVNKDVADLINGEKYRLAIEKNISISMVKI